MVIIMKRAPTEPTMMNSFSFFIVMVVAPDAAMPHERMKAKLVLDQTHIKIFLIADCGMS